MLDILLDRSGDLLVSETGDVSIANSVRQAVKVRLRWIYNEWRLGPSLGFPWFENVLVKNPDSAMIQQLIRAEIMKVEKVKDAAVIFFEYDRKERNAKIIYTIKVDDETYREEVTLNV